MARTFREALAEQLEKAGITAYRLSQLVGVGRAAVSKLLDDKVKTVPSWETVVKIALALGVDVGVFVTPDIQLPLTGEPGKPGRPKAEEPEGEEGEPKSKKTAKGKKK